MWVSAAGPQRRVPSIVSLNERAMPMEVCISAEGARYDVELALARCAEVLPHLVAPGSKAGR